MLWGSVLDESIWNNNWFFFIYFNASCSGEDDVWTMYLVIGGAYASNFSKTPEDQMDFLSERIFKVPLFPYIWWKNTTKFIFWNPERQDLTTDWGIWWLHSAGLWCVSQRRPLLWCRLKSRHPFRTGELVPGRDSLKNIFEIESTEDCMEILSIKIKARCPTKVVQADAEVRD